MRCDHCAHDVPDGVFCTRCGAHQGTTEEFGNAKLREHRYAAHPGEHVAQPSVITTLFPHLGHHKIHEFRWAFIAGLAGVLVLYISGLIAAAILVAAFLVPVLYLVYLYEAQVYRDEPATILGWTIGGGVVVGLVLTVIVRIVYNPFATTPNPLAAPSVKIGGVAMALIAHVAFSGGTLVLVDTSVSPLFILFWQAAVDGALLVYVRYLLHHALLEEAAHMGFAETVCPSCHMHIVASGFCPNCGMALTAAPSHIKRSRRERTEATPRTPRRG